MLKYVLLFLFVAFNGANLVLANTCQESRVAWQNWVAKGEPYSVAVCQGSDPRNHFREANAELLQATTNYRHDIRSEAKLDRLAKAAKAALEAGLDERAKAYAEQALTLADRDRCINSVSKPSEARARLNAKSGVNEDFGDRAAQDFCDTPSSHWVALQTEGDAVATSDLVLGRLALLHGDVNRAEMFLLQSGRLKVGRQSSHFGPNMTLALELLKRQRSETVLRFLDEWSQVWQGTTEGSSLFGLHPSAKAKYPTSEQTSSSERKERLFALCSTALDWQRKAPGLIAFRAIENVADKALTSVSCPHPLTNEPRRIVPHVAAVAAA